ncbi:hypothetical protein KGP36_02700 [Patescibacteria group bacterium]|nr:hypothetical protein [Patescibacteria group bacterium]
MKIRDHGPELKERCKALYLQNIRLGSIVSETGVKQRTLNTWIHRYKWNSLLAATRQTREKIQGRVLSIQPSPETPGSNEARQTLAKAVQKAAGKLAELDPKATLKDLRKYGKALEPLVRSAKIVHGWGSESVGGVVMSEVLGHEQEPQSSIAISADVQQVSCGPDTATGSVQSQPVSAPIPQDTQVTVQQPVASPPN